MTKPKGEMRVYFANQNKHGLIVNLDIAKKGDVYTGDFHFLGGPHLRQSWHISGKGHTYSPQGRLLHQQKESPKDIQKPMRIVESAPNLKLIDWTYRPKNKILRKNVSVDVNLYKKNPSLNIAIWALPSVDGIHKALDFYKNDIVLKHELMDWTSPVILAVVCTSRPDFWETFERSIKKGKVR